MEDDDDEDEEEEEEEDSSWVTWKGSRRGARLERPSHLEPQGSFTTPQAL